MVNLFRGLIFCLAKFWSPDDTFSFDLAFLCKMGYSRPLFLYFFVFNTANSKLVFYIKWADDWGQTADLWWMKLFILLREFWPINWAQCVCPGVDSLSNCGGLSCHNHCLYWGNSNTSIKLQFLCEILMETSGHTNGRLVIIPNSQFLPSHFCSF